MLPRAHRHALWCIVIVHVCEPVSCCNIACFNDSLYIILRHISTNVHLWDSLPCVCYRSNLHWLQFHSWWAENLLLLPWSGHRVWLHWQIYRLSCFSDLQGKDKIIVLLLNQPLFTLYILHKTYSGLYYLIAIQMFCLCIDVFYKYGWVFQYRRPNNCWGTWWENKVEI